MPAAAAASSAAAAVGRSVTFARIPGIPIAAAPEPADVDGGDADLTEGGLAVAWRLPPVLCHSTGGSMLLMR